MPVFDRESVTRVLNNVEGLNLAIGANAKKVVHLTAGDEYRSFFRLTNIASSISAGVGFELELPGSHCDIGGGDKDNMTEKLWVDSYKGLTNRLIREGWHTGKEYTEIGVLNKENIQIPYTDPYTGAMVYGTPPYIIIKRHFYVERTVMAGYHKIPMSIMMNFAKTYAKVNYKPLDPSYPIPADLKGLSDRMLSFAIQQSGKRRASAMHILNDPQFKWVRNKYLHLSAFPESGKNYEKVQNEDGSESSEPENDKMADIVKDVVLKRNLKGELMDSPPLADGDYSKRPERGINEG